MQGLGDRGEVYDETERKTKVKFDDVAGLDEEKEEIKPTGNTLDIIQPVCVAL